MINFLKLLILSSTFFSWSVFAATYAAQGQINPYDVDIISITCSAPTAKLQFYMVAATGPAAKITATGPNYATAVDSTFSSTFVNGGTGTYLLMIEKVTPTTGTSSVSYAAFCLSSANAQTGQVWGRLQNDSITTTPPAISASTGLQNKVDISVASSPTYRRHVYRSASAAGPFSLIGTIEINTTVFSDTNVTPGTTYWYKVSQTYGPFTLKGYVTNPLNSSTFGTAVTGSAIADPNPPAPTGLAVSIASNDHAVLSWNTNSNPVVGGYKVYRSTSSAGPFDVIEAFVSSAAPGNPSGTIDAQMTPDIDYWYAVSSLVNDGSGSEGVKSAAVFGGRINSPPIAPTGLTASTTTLDQVNLTWGAVSGASYKVYRATSSTGPFTTPIASPAGTSFADTTSVNGTSYWYTVSAVTNGNEGSKSASVTGKSVGLPATPTGLTASTTTLDQVNLTWTAVSGASYKVYRGASSGGAFTLLASPAGTSFADTTSVNGTPYWYKVSAVTNGNEGSQSSAVTGQSVGLPATPTGLTASTTTLDQVNLTWGAVSGATYKVYRDSSAGGAFSTVLATSGATSFADTTTTNGTSYWYKVSAVTNGNEGAKSAAVTGQSVGLPATPAGLTASTTVLDQVNLSWTAVSGASYKVYRDSSAGGAFSTVLATSGTTSFADTTTTNGTSYWYKVSAVTNGNEGAKSAAVTGQSVGLPATPAGLSASTTVLDQVNLSWTAVSGATYKVYRGASSTGPFTTPIASPTGTSFSDTTSVNGTNYWYTVSAVTNGNEGAQSTAVTGQSVALPVAPTGLTASTTSLDQVDLAWDVITDASYKVYRGTSPTGPFSLLTSPTGTSFADTTSVNGTSYWYTVSAVTNGNEGAQSVAVTGESIGLPATPAGLTASNNQVDKIDLSWTAVAGAQYLIYRADTSTGPFNVLGSVTTENYSDTSITSGIAYWYTVSAIAYGNEGAQSTPASGQALAMPAIPSGLTATQGTVIERVGLTWTAVSAVTGYGVYRDGAQVGVTSDLFYDDVLIGDILVHNYTISALASGLESAQSDGVSGFAKAQPTGGVVDGTTPPPATSHYKIVVKTPLH